MGNGEEEAEAAVLGGAGGEDIDATFQEGECVAVDFGSDEEPPAPSSGDEDMEEQGTVDEAEIYGELAAQPEIDDAAVSVTHASSVLSVAFCPGDWRRFATGGQDDVARLWSLEAGPADDHGLSCRSLACLGGHTDSVIQVAFSHDGRYLATGSYDGKLKVWSSSCELVATLEGPSKEVEWVAWHPRGHVIAAGSADTLAWMWSLPKGNLMNCFAGHADSVTCGCWGADGKVLVTGCGDGGAIVWNPREAIALQRFPDLHEGGVICVCAHPEAPVAVTGSMDSTASVLQLDTGKVVATLAQHTDSVEAVAFSRPVVNGQPLLATGSMDGKVNVWDGGTYQHRCTLKDHVGSGGIVRLKWLHSALHSSWLCTCSTDGTLRVFNALSGSCLTTLRGHVDTVLDLDVVVPESCLDEPEPFFVLSGSEDHSCRVFQVIVAPLAPVEV